MTRRYSTPCLACNGRFLRVPKCRCCGGRGKVDVLLDSELSLAELITEAKEAARKLANTAYLGDYPKIP